MRDFAGGMGWHTAVYRLQLLRNNNKRAPVIISGMKKCSRYILKEGGGGGTDLNGKYDEPINIKNVQHTHNR